ncbi:MAG: TonB-dependent receptor plug domain-containing protein, partial [Bacteroidales bacterium]|nr:TonB-dependent receptor plug domain-containing protein [Bacteroidales bacterium]
MKKFHFPHLRSLLRHTRIKCYVVTLSLICCFALPSMAQNQRYSGTFKDVNIKTVLESIQKKTGVKFVYNKALLKSTDLISATAENETVDNFLRVILRPLGLDFVWQDGVVVIRRKNADSKKFNISGQVTDSGNEPLPGVNITVIGTAIGTTTDLQGKYSLTATGESILKFSFIGMEPQLVPCNQRETINVIMKEDLRIMDEAVVTGYQIIDRSQLTSAVTSIKMDDIKTPGITTLDQMLEGRIPGMIFMKNSGQVGASPKLRIRGTSTILGNREPLWVLDGIVLSDPVNVDPQQINDPDFVNLLGNAISGLNPDDIEQIDVLKDASATALYGAKAGNGVIVISTKKGKIGRPSIIYSGTFGYSTRPRYSDRSIYMMNSAERMDVAKELIDRKMYYNNISQWSGYEQALQE